MRRFTLWIFLGVLLAEVLGANPGQAGGREPIQDALNARYRVSKVEIQDWRTEGRVRELGSVLTLQGEGVPANHLWVSAPTGTKFRRVHRFDYARSEITMDGRLIPEHVNRWAHFTLPKGTQLVVLDLKVEGDRVRLFTHTLEPVRLPNGEAHYGCTELAFRVAPGILERGDLAAIQRQLDQLVPLTDAKPRGTS